MGGGWLQIEQMPNGGMGTSLGTLLEIAAQQDKGDDATDGIEVKIPKSATELFMR